MTNPLARPLDLPCGATLSNRLAKAAMSEGLADSRNHSTPRLETLYRRWAGSAAGLLLSGNMQVDRWHLERPNNVVIDDDSGRAQLVRLAEAGTLQGAHFWAQLSHTGRQVSSYINPAPLSCSDVEIDVAGVCRRSREKKPMAKTCKSAEAAALVATAALLLALLGERPALAREQGTEQERKACMPDVFRLCNAFIPNPEQIIACLQQNVSTLSPACREVMDGAAQP